MAKNTPANTDKPAQKRIPKAATLRVHLQDYMTVNDIGIDASIGLVLTKLGDSIIEAEEAKIRNT